MEPTSNPDTGSSSTPPPAERAPLAPAEKGQEGPAGAEVQRPTPERGQERLGNPEQSRTSQSMVLPPVQAPPAQFPATPAPAHPASGDDTPVIADDVDVIEMEWVNKAKKIIKDTRNDPHAQEEAVERLQINYLKKRYGKDIKQSRAQ